MTTTPTQSQEREGLVTFKGNPLTLVGQEVKVGSKAPEFTVLGQDLSAVTLEQFQGKNILISVVPSLDTGVCDAQTRRFNEEAAKLENVQILTISMDLPFAQKRWCGAAGIDRVKVVSDHRAVSFGTAYGVLMKELRLLARSIFIIDRNCTIRYIEIVPEMTSPPNYDAALEAVKQIDS